MFSSFMPPRRVTIGDAASFVGTTPRAIRHYHAIGLLPEPERGSDGRRHYGYGDMIQLLWIRRMTDAGIALNDIRDAFADPALPEAEGGAEVAGILERLEQALVAREAEARRQRVDVQRMRKRGARMGLLSDLVSDRLVSLPDGSLRTEDLDTLLVTERIFGRMGAAVQASRFIALATSPGLRTESDCVDAAEAALDDTVAVDDPRVAQVAAERCSFESALNAVIEESGLADDEEALFDAEEARIGASFPAHDQGEQEGHDSGWENRLMEGAAAARMMPYDFSPARVRCMELAEELRARSVQTG